MCVVLRRRAHTKFVIWLPDSQAKHPYHTIGIVAVGVVVVVIVAVGARVVMVVVLR
jgi:hypothetical protein